MHYIMTICVCAQPFRLKYSAANALAHLMMKRRKLSNALIADRQSDDGSLPLISVTSLPGQLLGFIGAGMAIPLPMQPKKLKSDLGQKAILDELDTLFKKHLGMPDPQRIGVNLTKRSGRSDTSFSYTKAEVSEWMWSVIASYVDAKILASLPRDSNRKDARRCKSQQHLNALDGHGWPIDDAEWRCGANAIISLLQSDDSQTWPIDCSGGCSSKGVDPYLKPTSTDEVIEYVAEAVLHFTDVKLNMSLLHDHFGPLCLTLEPSLFLAKTLVRSTILEELVGNTLAIVVRRRQFESDWMVVLCLGGDEENTLARVSQELVESREQMLHLKMEVTRGRLDRVRDLCGRSLVVVQPGSHATTWRGDKRIASNIKMHQDVCGLLGAHTACIATSKLSRYYREVALSGSSDQASKLLDTYGNDRRLREALLRYDEAVELYAVSEMDKVKQKQPTSTTPLTNTIRALTCRRAMLCLYTYAHM